MLKIKSLYTCGLSKMFIVKIIQDGIDKFNKSA